MFSGVQSESGGSSTVGQVAFPRKLGFIPFDCIGDEVVGKSHTQAEHSCVGLRRQSSVLVMGAKLDESESERERENMAGSSLAAHSHLKGPHPLGT